ncbi:hypothetical protein M2271_005585 [Streptomyces sp. LBL]|uniref:hypothetical protein n=1 Tax=Streptomyces sp. LBL TaxID=2940562 RepID=UPI002474B389|nr:hypothetical protein [Streptomyces sp. LBL]MDH6627756.1 hypothetical protein [Streptomyces sp. LBL]
MLGRRPTETGHHDLLRLARDAAQARGHGATPVRAMTARRSASPVVLKPASCAILVMGATSFPGTGTCGKLLEDTSETEITGPL